MKNKTTKTKFKTRNIIIASLVSVTIIVCTVFCAPTIARLVKKLALDTQSIPAADFYFTSDMLKEDGNTVVIFEWDNTKELEDAIHFYDYDINDSTKKSTFVYSFTLSSKDQRGSYSNGVFTKSEEYISRHNRDLSFTNGVATESITPRTLNEGQNAIRIEIEAVAKNYNKKLSATLIYVTGAEEDRIQMFDDAVNGTSSTSYVTMKIYTAPNATNDYISFDVEWSSDTLYPDMTNDLYIDGAKSGTNTVRVKLRTGGYYEWIFYKASSASSNSTLTTNYSDFSPYSSTNPGIVNGMVPSGANNWIRGFKWNDITYSNN